jgi:predicted lipid-binding transport protein (Tim44 family)
MKHAALLLLVAAVLLLAALRVRTLRGRRPRRRHQAGADYDLTQLGQESFQPQQHFEAIAAAAAALPEAQRREVLGLAREHYLQLRQAWDAGDLAGLQACTTPTVYTQLRDGIEQRNHAPGRTEIVTLQAVLLDLRQRGDDYLASVEFSGLLREPSWGGAQPMREIWSLVRPVSGATGWLLSGIEPLS